MKIIAVGWNYPSHSEEMGVPKKEKNTPTIFMKPDSALLKSNKPFFIPDFSKQVEYEAELVVRICRLGKCISPKFAHRYYDAFTIGIDFTARDLQNKLRAEGEPWELSKAFDASAAIGTFIPKEKIEDPNAVPFHLSINEQIVQQAISNEMCYKIDELIAYISQYCTLKIGDLIFTGTPAGVGQVQINDHLKGYIGENKLLDFYVK